MEKIGEKLRNKQNLKCSFFGKYKVNIPRHMLYKSVIGLCQISPIIILWTFAFVLQFIIKTNSNDAYYLFATADTEYSDSAASRIVADIANSSIILGFCLVALALLLICWRKADNNKRTIYSSCEYACLVCFLKNINVNLSCVYFCLLTWCKKRYDLLRSNGRVTLADFELLALDELFHKNS